MNVLELQSWIEETDEIIKHVNAIELKAHNGEVFVAKPPITDQFTTKSGVTLYRPEDQARRQSYFQGFGRIILLPETGFASTEGTIDLPRTMMQGDFIIYTHSARYPINDRELFNIFIEGEYEKGADDTYDGEFTDISVFCYVPFPEIRMSKSGEAFKSALNKLGGKAV